MSPAKMAELVETWVGLENHVSDGDADPPWEGAVLRGGRGGPL